MRSEPETPALRLYAKGPKSLRMFHVECECGGFRDAGNSVSALWLRMEMHIGKHYREVA